MAERKISCRSWRGEEYTEEDTKYKTWSEHGTHTETEIHEMSASVTAHTKGVHDAKCGAT